MEFKPDSVKRPQWKMTEDAPEHEDIWQHRKYCANGLNFTQVKELADRFTSACHTMGALTIEHGMMDAISWNDDDAGYYGNSLNVYLAPFIENGDELYEEIMKYGDDVHFQNVLEAQICPRMKEALELLEDFEFIDHTDFTDIEKIEDLQEGGRYEKYRWLIENQVFDVIPEQMYLNLKETGGKDGL